MRANTLNPERRRARRLVGELPGGYNDSPCEEEPSCRSRTDGWLWLANVNGTPLASRLDRRHAMRPPRTVLGETFDTESQTLGLRQSGVTHPISRGEGGWDER